MLASPLPRLAEDRKLIGAQAELAILGRPLGLAEREAAQRAFYRDRAWLDSAVAKGKALKLVKERADLMVLMGAVRKRWDAKDGRPMRFSLAAAARELGTSVKTLATRLKSVGIGTEAASESVQAYRERALRWAARERLKRGQTLAPTKVCELAGLTARVPIIGIAKKVALSMEREIGPNGVAGNIH